MTTNPNHFRRPDPGVGGYVQALDFGADSTSAGMVPTAGPLWVPAGTKIAFPLTKDGLGSDNGMIENGSLGTPIKFKYSPTVAGGPIIVVGLHIYMLYTGACDPGNFAASTALTNGIWFEFLDTGGTAFSTFTMPQISTNGAMFELLDKSPFVGASKSCIAGRWMFPCAVMLKPLEAFQASIRDDITGGPYALTELSMRLIGFQLPAND